MTYLQKSLLLAVMLNVVSGASSLATATPTSDKVYSTEFKFLNSAVSMPTNSYESLTTDTHLTTKQLVQVNANSNVNIANTHTVTIKGNVNSQQINTNSFNSNDSNFINQAIAKTNAQSNQCISIGMNPNYTKVVTTNVTNNNVSAKVDLSTSNNHNATNNVNMSANSSTPALTEKQVAYFSQPLSLAATPNTDIPYTPDGSTFEEFKAFLIQQAIKQGFNQNVIRAIKNIKLNKTVIRFDMRQYERIKVKPPVVTPNPTSNTTSTNTTNNTSSSGSSSSSSVSFTPSHLMQKYLSLHITQGKVDRALSLLDNYRFMLDQISETYHVPVQVIIGLWGMETSFGKNQGNYKLLDSLASLAYEGRRRTFFLQEFFNALRIIQLNNFDANNVLSSWAGAIGQIQFMPSSFLNYAVDGNGDGVVNIWYSTIDSFASIANYLHKNNWNDQIPWGVKVNLTVDQYLTFLKQKAIGIEADSHTLDGWQKLGVDLDMDQDAILNLDTMPSTTPLWLVVPDNEPDQAYLVTTNYKAYLRWNRSKYFAFANGIFADRIFESEQIRNKQDQTNSNNSNN